MSNGAQRGRYWVWTLNTPTQEEETTIVALADTGDVQYLCFGREVCPTTGRPHLQGYLELPTKTRLGGVKRLGGLQRAHFELRRGTFTQAVDYCKKDGHFVSFGASSGDRPGKRNDLEEVKELLDAGASESTIAETHFGSWVRNRHAFKEYQVLQQSKKRQSIAKDVVVLIGPPGVGKTRIVFEREPELFIVNDPTLSWFDGYQGEEAVLIDDFRCEAKGSFLLRLLDRYPMSVPVKGSFVPWTPKRIYITSNLPFDSWYALSNAEIATPLQRRVTRLFDMALPLDFEDDHEMAMARHMIFGDDAPERPEGALNEI